MRFNSIDNDTSKTPLPKRSVSPTHRSTLERNNNVLLKSGSLSDLPNGFIIPIKKPNNLFNEYSVGQPGLKVPRKPHAVKISALNHV